MSMIFIFAQMWTGAFALVHALQKLF